MLTRFDAALLLTAKRFHTTAQGRAAHPGLSDPNHNSTPEGNAVKDSGTGNTSTTRKRVCLCTRWDSLACASCWYLPQRSATALAGGPVAGLDAALALGDELVVGQGRDLVCFQGLA